ncbi:MAG: hypothetical protein ABFD20_12670 [Anaerolineales bacterium]
MPNSGWQRWRKRCGAAALVAMCSVWAWMAPVSAAPETPVDDEVMAQGAPTPIITDRAWVPIARRLGTCEPISGVSYADTPASGYPAGDPPADQHPDLNLSLRGWIRNPNAHLGLVDYSGSTDAKAPQLLGLLSDRRAPVFSAAYRVYDWNWANNTRGAPLTTYDATLAGLQTIPGETVHVPASGYNIGDTARYEVLVLYADQDSLTLKYTRDDNVIRGYTLHLEGLCVEPRLLALYEADNAAGRSRLPGLVEYQAVGRAAGTEIQVAIRDNGAFMDPRSHKDWWRAVVSARQPVEQQPTMRHDVTGQSQQ